jgi:hypothetical protein
MNELLSSVVYLLIWISFWGLIDTLIMKYVKDINYKLYIYISMLILSCLIYVFVLNKNININRTIYKNKDNK